MTDLLVVCRVKKRTCALFITMLLNKSAVQLANCGTEWGGAYELLCVPKHALKAHMPSYKSTSSVKQMRSDIVDLTAPFCVGASSSSGRTRADDDDPPPTALLSADGRSERGSETSHTLFALDASAYLNGHR
jgi:hypothetical protein